MEDEMKRLLSALWTPLFPVFVFLLCQLAGVGVVYANCSLSISLFLVEIFVIVWLLAGKKVKREDFHIDSSWRSRQFVVALLGAFSIMFAMNVVSELMGLPDYAMKTVIEVVKSPLGVLSIALLGPIAEEMCFRGAIIGGMLREGRDPWTAILVSSLLFGLIHFNPAQIPFAMVMGAVLGIIYVRTESLLLPIFVHVFNNSTAVVQLFLMGDAAEDFKMSGVIDQRYLIVGGAIYLIIGVAMMYWFARIPKSRLREEIRSRKSSYSQERLHDMSLALERSLMERREWWESQTVLLYHALPDEVDTSLLLSAALESGKTVLLPRVDGERLTLHPYDPSLMQSGGYGIMEPCTPAFPESRYGEIDMVLVPGMAFDRRGHRLGRGKGFYDRLLPNLKKAHLVGICFPFQMVAKVPCDKFDVKVDDVCWSV